MIPKIILEAVRMSALRKKVEFYALLFDIPTHTVQIEVQGVFQTKQGEAVFLKRGWHKVVFIGALSNQISAQLDGETDYTVIIPEKENHAQ